MSLSGFKGIFWWEYFHRSLGRVIGLVFMVPLLWFWARRHIDRQLALKLLGVFVLGVLQGAMGWYMVQSGLVDDPRVSHYRLTAHLGLALLIFAAMLSVDLDLLFPRRTPLAAARRLRGHATGLLLLIILMVLTGGLVAGLRAGLAYNTFPLMNGNLVPPEIFMIEPWCPWHYLMDFLFSAWPQTGCERHSQFCRPGVGQGPILLGNTMQRKLGPGPAQPLWLFAGETAISSSQRIGYCFAA